MFILVNTCLNCYSQIFLCPSFLWLNSCDFPHGKKNSYVILCEVNMTTFKSIMWWHKTCENMISCEICFTTLGCKISTCDFINYTWPYLNVFHVKVLIQCLNVKVFVKMQLSMWQLGFDMWRFFTCESANSTCESAIQNMLFSSHVKRWC